MSPVDRRDEPATRAAPERGADGDGNGSGTGNGERFMEIGGPGRVNIVGLLSYALLFAGACGVLVLLFVRFTGSMRLALALVVFMVSYMALMGWWASRTDR